MSRIFHNHDISTAKAKVAHHEISKAATSMNSRLDSVTNVLDAYQAKVSALNKGFEDKLEVIKREEEEKQRKINERKRRIQDKEDAKRRKIQARFQWMLKGEPFNLRTQKLAMTRSKTR